MTHVGFLLAGYENTYKQPSCHSNLLHLHVHESIDFAVVQSLVFLRSINYTQFIHVLYVPTRCVSHAES